MLPPTSFPNATHEGRTPRASARRLDCLDGGGLAAFSIALIEDHETPERWLQLAQRWGPPGRGLQTGVRRVFAGQSHGLSLSTSATAGHSQYALLFGKQNL